MKTAGVSIIFIAFTAMLCSCDRERQISSTDHFVFDLNDEAIEMANLIDDYEIYQLETNDSILVNRIDKAVIGNGMFYILNRKDIPNVTIFDNNGHFVSRIERYGNGPQEYIQLMDIYIDDSDNTINLLCREPRKIYKYNSTGDKLLKEISLERAYVSFVKANENNYIGYQGNFSQVFSHKNLSEFNDQGQVLEQWIDIDPQKESAFSLNSQPLAIGYDRSIMFIPPEEFSLYKFENNNFNCIADLDFGEYTLSKDDKNTPEHLLAINKVMSVNHYTETEKHYIFNFLFQGQFRFGIVNKSDYETSIATPDAPDDKYFISFGNIVNFDKDKLICSVDADNMDFYLTGKNEYCDFSEKYKKQIDNLNRRIEDLKSDDNPLLIVYTLK